MKRIVWVKDAVRVLFLLAISAFSYAGAPVWTFTPLTATSISVPANDTATIQYQVTNQSSKAHRLSMQSIQGITQTTTGLGICGNPFVLTGNASCTLSLQVNGSQLTSPINDGPIVCEQGSSLQCYRPASSDILHVTQASAITDATITVTGSPLTLTTDGPTGTLTINNTSLIVTATNIMSNFTGTALNGYVTETGNTCASVAPQSSCTLTYTPGGTTVSQTSFPIQGANTNAATAAIQIDQGITISTVSPSRGPASGGTGVTLTGTGFNGATSLTFGGTAATSVNVVSTTSVTAVTPLHATGVVDVVITTPSGSATEVSGFTYDTPTVGQLAYGGTIACLNGGLNYLIAATTDISTSSVWGTGAVGGATSTIDGVANTQQIVTALGNSSSYAARLCSDYEVDSLANTPCQSGNTCYSDWFLPAGNNLTTTGQLNCLYTNRVAIQAANAPYWSSTQLSLNNAFSQNFANGSEVSGLKTGLLRVRCVRSFNPS
jgi:hypothetical protein